MLMHFIFFLKSAHLHDLFHKELGLAIRVCATPCSMILVDWKIFGFTISVMNMLNKDRNFLNIYLCVYCININKDDKQDQEQMV